MREQIRLWFYSQCFMAVTLDGRSRRTAACSTYEKVYDETGRADAQVVGQRDRAERGARADGRRRHALALLRAAAEPDAPLRLPHGRRGEAAAAHVLELGLVLRHVRERRRLRSEPTPAGDLQPLDRWLRRADRAARARRDGRSTSATGRPASCRRSRRSSTISRTGTSAARAGASGRATRPRSACCGTR